jgi:riboflavin biosynthesis pyrimidine reductase
VTSGSASESATADLYPLLSAPPLAGGARDARLPDALRARYGGDLLLPLRDGRPTIVANFVSTLDGVVTFDPASGKGGGEVSGFFEPDRLVMGLLRSLADVVLVGAGTVRADPRGRWTPASIHPRSAAQFAEMRSALGLTEQPTTVILSASGDLSLAHPGLADPAIPVVIVTTEAGAQLIGDTSNGPNVRVVSAGRDQVDASDLVAVLAAMNARVVLCEGGPRVFGQLLEARLVDELFMTLSPQIAGRNEGDARVPLVDGVDFDVSDAPWAALIDLRVSGSHLFTRYRFEGRD